MAGRVTLGLYNCYDPKQWHDIMRITLARAAPVAVAFGCDLATFGFPFAQARRRGAKTSAALRTPMEVAQFVAEGTSIDEGGQSLVDLASQGRLHLHDFPAAAFPAKHGALVVTTPQPESGKASTPLDLARSLAAGAPHLVLFGLGPRGLPAGVLAQAASHLEITGQRISMETATALGALPAMLHAHLAHLEGRS